MKGLTFYTLFILCIFLLVSCEKEYENFSNAVLVPLEITESYTTYTTDRFVWEEKVSTYSYDTRARFSGIETTTYTEGRAGTVQNVSFDYDKNDNLISRYIYTVTDTSEVFQVIHYLYTGNEIEIRADGKLTGVVVLKEDRDTPLLYTIYRERENYSSESEHTKYIYEYQYQYDENRNVIEKTQVYVSGQTTDIYKEAYQYDNQNSFYKHVNMPLWYKVTQGTLFLYNNPTGLYHKDLEGNSRLWEVFEYEYNKEGYPVQIEKKLNPEEYPNAIETTYRISYR